MITSNFFNNYNNFNEQTLLEDLVIESIKIFGIDTYYIAKTLTNLDPLYQQDDQPIFQNAWLIEVYLKTVMGFGGDREFMSKFLGVEARDQIVFNISRRRFVDEIGKELNTTRPREGDLLFFPFPGQQKVFEIKYVNQLEVFYQLGNLTTWEVTCELYEYSNEKFRTGIPEIDAIESRLSIDVLFHSIKDTDGAVLKFEDGSWWSSDLFKEEIPLADNETIQDRSEDIVNWSETDPFSEEGITEKVI